jgi:pteridine reductase
MTDFNQRPHAWIIGGANRIGRAIAIELARAGCNILITYNTSREDAGTTAQECQNLGAQAQARPLALDDPSSVVPQVQQLLREQPRCDILVLSASAYRATNLDQVDSQELLHMFSVNAASHALIAQTLAPTLRTSTLAGGGAIVAMLDIHALGTPRRNHLAYAMSKAALAQAVQSLAIELAPHVRVNGLAIGVAAWPTSGPDADPSMQANYLKKVPLARAGTPQEAAVATRFLALEATFTTGHFLTLDGGRSST